MFKIGQVLKLKLPATEGVIEAKVIATGGGNTTVRPERRMCEGYAYEVNKQLRCFTDEELTKMAAA